MYKSRYKKYKITKLKAESKFSEIIKNLFQSTFLGKIKTKKIWFHSLQYNALSNKKELKNSESTASLKFQDVTPYCVVFSEIYRIEEIDSFINKYIRFFNQNKDIFDNKLQIKQRLSNAKNSYHFNGWGSIGTIHLKKEKNTDFIDRIEFYYIRKSKSYILIYALVFVSKKFKDYYQVILNSPEFTDTVFGVNNIIDFLTRKSPLISISIQTDYRSKYFDFLLNDLSIQFNKIFFNNNKGVFLNANGGMPKVLFIPISQQIFPKYESKIIYNFGLSSLRSYEYKSSKEIIKCFFSNNNLSLKSNYLASFFVNEDLDPKENNKVTSDYRKVWGYSMDIVYLWTFLNLLNIYESKLITTRNHVYTFSRYRFLDPFYKKTLKFKSELNDINMEIERLNNEFFDGKTKRSFNETNILDAVEKIKGWNSEEEITLEKNLNSVIEHKLKDLKETIYSYTNYFDRTSQDRYFKITLYNQIITIFLTIVVIILTITIDDNLLKLIKFLKDFLNSI